MSNWLDDYRGKSLAICRITIHIGWYTGIKIEDEYARKSVIKINRQLSSPA
jgi:hypothetical protein